MEVAAETAGVVNDADSGANNQAAANETPPDTGDIETRAKAMGWSPKDEFRGDPERWTPAKEFVERGETLLPVLRERYRALETRYGKQEAETAEMKQRIQEMQTVLVEQRDLSRRALETTYERAKAEIQAKMDAAVETADRESYQRSKAELANLEKQTPPPPVAPPVAAASPVAVDPAINEWIERNPWFNSDRDLNDFATARNMRLLRERPDMTMRENLAEVKRAVMEKFPEKFENQRRAAPPAVATPSAASGAGRKKGKTAADLPPDAKAALARFMKSIPGYKEAEYVNMYFAGEE